MHLVLEKWKKAFLEKIVSNTLFLACWFDSLVQSGMWLTIKW